jgi:hypothetical protein
VRLIRVLPHAERFLPDDESFLSREKTFLSREESFLSRVGRVPVGVSGSSNKPEEDCRIPSEDSVRASGTCALIREAVRQT